MSAQPARDVVREVLRGDGHREEEARRHVGGARDGHGRQVPVRPLVLESCGPVLFAVAQARLIDYPNQLSIVAHVRQDATLPAPGLRLRYRAMRMGDGIAMHFDFSRCTQVQRSC